MNVKGLISSSFLLLAENMDVYIMNYKEMRNTLEQMVDENHEDFTKTFTYY